MSVWSRALFVMVAFVYLVAFPYHPALRSPNELSRLWQTRSIADHGTLELNQVLREHGMVGDLSIREGRYYPSKAPLLSFLAVPVYAGLKAWAQVRTGRPAVPEVPLVFWSRLFVTVLPTLVLLVFLRRFLLAYLPAAVVDPLVATYALGTMAMNYSLMFLSHQLTATLCFGAFYALWRVGRGDWRPRGDVLAGAFAGAVVVCEYTGALTVFGLVLYAVLDRTRGVEGARRKLLTVLPAAGRAALGALPFVLGLMAYHQVCFGHPLMSGYKFLNDPGYQPWHVGGFLGIRYPDPRAFVLSFFSPLRGLFVVSPFLLLGVLGLKLLRPRDRPLFWLAAALLLGNAYFTSSFAYDSWGWAAGPRHLTPLLPFLVLPAGLWLERWRAKGGLPLGMAAGLCAASVAITGTIALVNYVPPELSTSLFGLAVPLHLEGYLTPTVLSFLGVSNPWSGGLVWALVGTVSLLVGLRTLAAGAQRAWGAVGAVSTLVLLLGVLALATRNDRTDLGARGVLRSSWFAPPGVTPRFWR